MSAVVLRCPNCGTTQNIQGECDACHEAAVRYFCPNHTPGRWLDGPKCEQCGAEFGREPVAPPRPPPSPPPSRPRQRRPAPTPTSRPSAPPPPYRVPVDDTPARGGGSTRRPYDEPPATPFPDLPTRRTPVGGRREPPPTRPSASVEDLLEELRRRHTPDVGPSRVPVPAPPRAPMARVPGATVGTFVGCLTRLVLMVGLLIALGAAALYYFVGGANVEQWVTDVGQSVGVAGGVPEQTQRGIAAFEAGDYATAQRELEEAARVYRTSGLALVYLARIRADAGDLEGSIEYLDEAVRREPESAIAHRELADSYYARAKQLSQSPERTTNPALVDATLRSAADEYARVLRINPSDQRSRTGYACAIVGLGAVAEGERILQGMGTSSSQACR